MNKRMKKLPFLFKNTEILPWPQWPSCNQPKTLSFRGTDDILKTLNSSYDNTPELCSITNSSEYESFSTAATTAMTLEDDSGGGTGECIETVIHGLRSTDRLFFDPGMTSSILEETNKSAPAAAAAATSSPTTFKESSVVCSMESVDPYLDFKKSMEEMVEAHGLLKDWDRLEELLCWYLKVNGKDSHGYIVAAFVDLVLGFTFTKTTTTASTTSCSCSPSSPLSYTCSSTTATTSTTTCSSSFQS